MEKTSLRSLYSFPGFFALATLKEVPEDPGARIIVLRRRQKKRFVPAVRLKEASTIARPIKFGIWIQAASASISHSSTAGCFVGGVRP